MSNKTEISQNENFMKIHFVKVMKDYSAELLYGPAIEKQELANWLDLQVKILLVENAHQSLADFIALILENCLIVFPAMFPTLYSNTLFALENVPEHIYLEMIDQTDYDTQEKLEEHIDQLRPFVPVIKNAVKTFRTTYKNKQSTN